MRQRCRDRWRGCGEERVVAGRSEARGLVVFATSNGVEAEGAREAGVQKGEAKGATPGRRGAQQFGGAPGGRKCKSA